MDQTINQAAVEQFVAGAKGATVDQVKQVIARMDGMMARKECPFLGGQKINLATVAEARRRLAEQI